MRAYSDTSCVFLLSEEGKLEIFPVEKMPEVFAASHIAEGTGKQMYHEKQIQHVI